MDDKRLQQILADIHLPAIRYYPSVGSTNDIALKWLQEGAEEFSIVGADWQTAGRGRMNRTWVTEQNQGLAFSVILHPKPGEKLPLFSTLGAVAVCEVLIQQYYLFSEIKWPNDVLVNGKKICGILSETHWDGNECSGVVLGIGINIGKRSIPSAEQLLFPATSLETETSHPIDRMVVLAAILTSLKKWRDLVGNSEFFHFWMEHLAFVNQPVEITEVEPKPIVGILMGINEEGDLQIRTEDGKTICVDMGEVHLRPVIKPKPVGKE